MPALFRPWANTAFRVALASAGLGVFGLVAFAMIWVRTPYATGAGIERDQPVQFDHRHHVADAGIDCRYCHDGVERSSTAGVPPTSVCMNCHAQLWPSAPALELVRASYFGDRSIVWQRVNRLPDFVYFDHSIHVAKGVGCVTCHGRVDQMPLVEQASTLTMGWCLDCHRDPAPHLRPREELTSMTWEPDGLDLGRDLARRNDVQPRTSCTACHR